MMNGVVVIFILSSFCLHIAADQNQLRGKAGNAIPASLRRLKGTYSRRVEENAPPWLESTTTEATSLATDAATGEVLSDVGTAANISGVSMLASCAEEKPICFPFLPAVALVFFTYQRLIDYTCHRYFTALRR